MMVNLSVLHLRKFNIKSIYDSEVSSLYIVILTKITFKMMIIIIENVVLKLYQIIYKNVFQISSRHSNRSSCSVILPS